MNVVPVARRKHPERTRGGEELIEGVFADAMMAYIEAPEISK